MPNTIMKLKVNGMHCPSCKTLIEEVLTDEGIKIKKFVKEDLEIDTSKNFSEIKKLIEQEGYKLELKK